MATPETVTAVHVNFIFANYEKKVVLATTLSSSGADLKSQLLDNWPEGVPVCEDRSRIRMVCMGNGFLTDDKILGPKFPIFAHPTPINVSIRPIQVVKSPSLTSTVPAQPNRNNGTASGVRPNLGTNRPNSGANRPNPGNNSGYTVNSRNNSGNSGANPGISSGSGPRSTPDGCPRVGVVRDSRGQSTAAGNGGACCVIN